VVWLDFTSSLYLGLRHAAESLRPWAGLTTGRPAALEEPPVAGHVARRLATLMGSAAGVLASSTLHLAWDLLGVLAVAPDPVQARAGSPRGITIYLDDGTYPILTWGVERAAALGTPVRRFRSHDHRRLRRDLAADAGQGRVPLVICDGSCPACGRVAPLAEYLGAAREFGGLVLIDDTQAHGVLGDRPAPAMPYGRGGGGSLRWNGIAGPELLVVASLAKGFGVPIALLAGNARWLARFTALSQTRMHCSPPSVAALHAAARALDLNRTDGDRLRWLLAARVTRCRDHLVRLGLSRGRSLFPVQLLDAPRGAAAARLHHALAGAGVRALLLSGGRGPDEARLAFILTASHSEAEIDAAAAVLERTLRRSPVQSSLTTDSRRHHACRHDGPSLDSKRPHPEYPGPARPPAASRREPLCGHHL
jgi:8-amino-7-oxononanoate synthase